MPTSIIKMIISVLFLAVIGFLILVSLLGIYILNKYGRTKSLTATVSMAFAGVFILLALSSLITITQIN